MNPHKKLPDAEFAVMRAIWHLPFPTTCRDIMDALDSDKAWKSQTVLTMLKRLEEKGFVTSHKQGKEREYAPLISEDEYLRIETGSFVRKFGKKSALSVLSTLCAEQELSAEEIADLSNWLEEQKRGQS